MAVPFMRSYCELLVKTCHRRGAHAMGGMAAFIPSRRDAEVNAVALEKVREDKDREASQGFDGTWVAHPDLVQVAMESFERVLGDRPNQIDRQRDDVAVGAGDLLDVAATPGDVTEEGLRNNVSVGIQYLAAWLQGSGAVAINNLMEDAATAEISRSQIWQWLRHDRVTESDVRRITDEEIAKLGDGYGDARALFEQVATQPDYRALRCPRTTGFARSTRSAERTQPTTGRAAIIQTPPQLVLPASSNTRAEPAPVPDRRRYDVP
jgi:malate synthase